MRQITLLVGVCAVACAGNRVEQVERPVELAADGTFEMRVRANVEASADTRGLRFTFVATSTAPGRSLPYLLHSDGYRYGIAKFKMTGINEGRFAAPLRFPFFVSVALGSQVLETKKIEQRLGDLVFRIPAERALSRLGSVGLTLVGPGGGPIPDGDAPGVLLDNGRGTQMRLRALGGAVRFDRLRTGLCHLTVSGGRSGRFNIDVHLAEPELFAVGELELRPAADFGGTVEDENGNPVSCKITAINAEGHGLAIPLGRPEATTSDERGRFRFRGLRRGKFHVVAYSDQHAIAATRIDTTRPEQVKKGCSLRLSSGRMISVTVAAKTVETSILVLSQDGSPLYCPRLEEHRSLAVRLAPGQYSLDVTGPSNRKSVPFRVTEQTERVLLSLK